MSTRKRKIKCDEAFPACQRCVSTGRVCDGYGIWGGGGNTYQDRQTKAVKKRTSEPLLLPAISTMVAGQMEKALFNWYRCRTATKIPGAFFSDFWTVLLPQASHSEPAVLHALLALSAVHFDGTSQNGTMQDGIGKNHAGGHAPKKMERVTLEHYNYAIRYLKGKSPVQVEDSRRITLITCVVFITIDLFRGHFATAQFHLQSGLKLLGQEHLSGNGLDNGADSVDIWIAEVFYRLLSQAALFGQSVQLRRPLLDAASLFPKGDRFGNLKEAWAGLTNLTNGVLALSQRARELKAQAECPTENAQLLGQQQRLRAGLTRWSRIYELSRRTLEGACTRDSLIAVRTLRCHHLMALIMTDVTLTPDDEMAYDARTDQFLRLIKELGAVWSEAVAPMKPLCAPLGRLANMNRSIVDMGWIPPLYYTAIKCRHHGIRLQAIRYLELSPHREGIWDSEIASRVARRIMNVEEGERCQDEAYDDASDGESFETLGNKTYPTIHKDQRIKGLEVVLSGSPLDQAILYSHQEGKSAEGKQCIGKFNVKTQRWVDNIK